MTEIHRKEIEIQVGLDQMDTDASFLSILADKNNEIVTLKKKISIQKHQLAYYIQKSTNWEQINTLAKTCDSTVDQLSFPVNLAIYNFCKKTGIQNHIELLYGYMKKASKKIENTLHAQETLLNRIGENVCKLAKRGYDALACEFGEFIVESKHLELFNNLLVATMALKRDLDSYRNCCNRLITIEDERNMIVDQIYSLPAEERMNVNYLMRLENEKHDLKNELKIISKKQQQLQQKFSGIGNLYKNDIKELQVDRVLNNVHTEALELLNLTNKHTNCNLKENIEPRLSIEEILKYIRLSFNQNETNITKTTFYGLIKNEIEKETQRWKRSYIKELNQKANECQSLHRHLNEITQERNKLYNIIKKFQKQLNEIKVSNKEEISRISMERDSFKAQIDDLEMIRTAYVELVEKQTDIATIEKNYHKQIIEQDRIVAELQDENNILTIQTTYQKNFIQLQSDFINYLSKNNSTTDTVQYFGQQFVDEYKFHISEENICCKSITQLNLEDIKTDQDNNVTCYINEKKSLTLTTVPEYVANEVNITERNIRSNTHIPLNGLINTGGSNNIIIQIDASGGSVQVLNNNTVCLKFVNNPASATPSKPIIPIDNCGIDDNMLMNNDGELNEIAPICCSSLSKGDNEEIY